jgi:hypothetical protein
MVVTAQANGKSIARLLPDTAMRCPIDMGDLNRHLLATRHAALMLSHPIPMRRGFKTWFRFEMIWR